jgi:hypothetical protein
VNLYEPALLFWFGNFLSAYLVSSPVLVIILMFDRLISVKFIHPNRYRLLVCVLGALLYVMTYLLGFGVLLQELPLTATKGNLSVLFQVNKGLILRCFFYSSYQSVDIGGIAKKYLRIPTL